MNVEYVLKKKPLKINLYGPVDVKVPVNMYIILVWNDGDMKT
jgi:hypothetical protein